MVCGSASSQAFREPRRGDSGTQKERAGRPRLRKALGDYCGQHLRWTGRETKARRSRKLLRVTSEPMAELGLGPSSF